MIMNEQRMQPYVAALRSCVGPESGVLDIGSGTGIFALLAAQFGARKVYAIEPDDAILLAQRIAMDNGLDNRIEFHRALSTRVELPERADVIISDLRGILPFFQQHIPSIVDARRRFLAPGGVLIPRRDTIWAAVVELQDLHKRITSPWTTSRFGIDMRAAHRLVTNEWVRATVKPENLLSQGQQIGTLDYRTIEDANFHASFESVMRRGGKATGLAVWFDAELTESIGFSNAPFDGELVYGAGFFPFPASLEVGEGDRLQTDLRLNLVGDDYVWFVRMKLSRECDPSATVEIGLSSLAAQLGGPEVWKRRAAEYKPRLGEDGQVEALVLNSMARNETLGEIASQVVARFPESFGSWESALAHVGDLSTRFSE